MSWDWDRRQAIRLRRCLVAPSQEDRDIDAIESSVLELQHAKGSLMRKEPGDSARAQAAARLAKFRDVDIPVLCECTIPSDMLLHALKAEDPRFEIPLALAVLNQPGRFKLFCRFAGSEMEPWDGDSRCYAVRLADRLFGLMSGVTDEAATQAHPRPGTAPGATVCRLVFP